MRTIIVKMLIALLVLSTMSISVSADDNTTVNVTGTPTITLTVTPAVVQTTVIPVTKQTFRVGPSVRLRPVNDVINKSADGIIELYMDNPSINDVTLNVDARVSVPAGIHVYGQGFGSAAAAGTVYGTFSVPPGTARTIYLNIKAEKVGSFTAHFSGLYWPENNKDDYQPLSLTHSFTVTEISSNIDSGVSTDETGGSILSEYWWLILIVIIVIVAIVAISRRS